MVVSQLRSTTLALYKFVCMYVCIIRAHFIISGLAAICEFVLFFFSEITKGVHGTTVQCIEYGNAPDVNVPRGAATQRNAPHPV